LNKERNAKRRARYQNDIEFRERELTRKRAFRDKFKQPLIYVLTADQHLFKVGMTKNLYDRMQHLKASSPIPLKVIHTIPTPEQHLKALEDHLHNVLLDYHSHGEWFRVRRKKLMTSVTKCVEKFLVEVAGVATVSAKIARSIRQNRKSIFSVWPSKAPYSRPQKITGRVKVTR
jgi:Meiotically up-regulated gene 113